MRQIAFFDFDGTITRKDTLLEFIKFNKGRFRFYIGFSVNILYLLSYKAGIITNQRAKEKILSYFFSGSLLQQFQADCDHFSKIYLSQLLRPKALHEITKLKNTGVEVVIVSASPENWIRPWTENMGVKLLSTRLEIKDEMITGKIDQLNCYGEEKVRRIKEIYDLTGYDEIFAYGDTKGDLPMLGIATKSFFRPFL